MTELTRRSPILAPGHSRDDVRDAVNQLEQNPRLATKTPANTSADGYVGEVRYDANYLYIYVSGVGWKRAALSTF